MHACTVNGISMCVHVHVPTLLLSLPALDVSAQSQSQSGIEWKYFQRDIELKPLESFKAGECKTYARGVVTQDRVSLLFFQGTSTLPNLPVSVVERLRRALIQKVNINSWVEYSTMWRVVLLVVLSATWMSVPASAATCPQIPNLSNGYYTTSISSFTNGGIATANCFPGYQANRPNFIKCGSDGTWPMGASSLPTCTSTTCSAAPTIANGYLTFNSGSFMDGGLATVSCFPGYNLTGSATISCRGGQWPSGAFRPTCTRVLCSRQVAPSNGAIASMSLEINGATIFTCNSGYNLVGSSASV
eukprot:scpid91549/ scgid2185/ Sushi, von Willebrand factor type A, EGF and pentraxin domain-containing protein 1; CCP module-containing protein 22; Polydom; Selectin-like osteoblast-derived protein; Serologically defined breast cancer antigen NY-BR-38